MWNFLYFFNIHNEVDPCLQNTTYPRLHPATLHVTPNITMQRFITWITCKTCSLTFKTCCFINKQVIFLFTIVVVFYVGFLLELREMSENISGLPLAIVEYSVQRHFVLKQLLSRWQDDGCAQFTSSVGSKCDDFCCTWGLKNS